MELKYHSSQPRSVITPLINISFYAYEGQLLPSWFSFVYSIIGTRLSMQLELRMSHTATLKIENAAEPQQNYSEYTVTKVLVKSVVYNVLKLRIMSLNGFCWLPA